MRKVVTLILCLVVLIGVLIALSGCTFQIETKDNSIEASVDGDTTEKVDSIIDWIKERFSRIFTTSEET